MRGLKTNFNGEVFQETACWIKKIPNKNKTK